tara:strand:+ start:2453 stop:3355 length:903 start_codon:yes stop_codon:yes gene_type:complete
MAIQTNISLTAPQQEFYQRFVDLAVNETPLPQGDATIRISPFDDYFLFTLYDEVDGEDTPIDLSNVGSIFMNFIGTSDEIDIKNHTQVEEVDLSQGQVLFRITRSDSKKVLALDNNNFYISTKMVNPDDGSISDESVLYQGIWLAFDTASRTTLTSQIEEQRLQYSIELAKLQSTNEELRQKNTILTTEASEDELTIQKLQINNAELVNEIAVLTENLDSTTAEALIRDSMAAQKAADQRMLIKQQQRALSNARGQAATQAKQIAFTKQAAANLQQFTLGRTPVSQPANNPFRDNNLLNK